MPDELFLKCKFGVNFAVQKWQILQKEGDFFFFFLISLIRTVDQKRGIYVLCAVLNTPESLQTNPGRTSSSFYSCTPPAPFCILFCARPPRKASFIFGRVRSRNHLGCK